MGSFARLLNLLAIPLMLINIFGGIVSGIWLAILGEWGLIGYGILALVIGPFVIGLCTLPSMVFAMPAVVMVEKGHNFIGHIFGFLATALTLCAVTAWCLFVLIYYTNQATSASIIPVLIWSYGVATGPITYLAQKDMQAGNEYGALTAFFIQIAYIITILAMLFIGISFIHVLVIFGVIMFVAIVVNFTVAYMLENPYQQY